MLQYCNAIMINEIRSGRVISHSVFGQIRITYNLKCITWAKLGFIFVIFRIPKFGTHCNQCLCNVVRFFLPSLDQDHFDDFGCVRSRCLKFLKIFLEKVFNLISWITISNDIINLLSKKRFQIDAKSFGPRTNQVKA